MKKLMIIILSFLMLFSFISYCYANSGNVYTVKVNGVTVKTDVPPIHINNHHLVPVRPVFEKLGAALVWDVAKQKMSITLKNTKIELKSNDTNAKVNNKIVKLVVPPKKVNQRLMVPVEFIKEQLNMQVGVYPPKNLITIDNPKSIKNITKSPVLIPKGKIVYHNSGDRIYLSLAGVKLTEGGKSVKRFYTSKYDASGKKFTITFSSSVASLGSTYIKVTDDVIESIDVINNKKTKEISVVFHAKARFYYEIIWRSETNDTAVTILNPASQADKLVVIDPGHGGREPGAIYSGVYEKNLNLDIALRLKKLLQDRNIRTYMIREDDSFVGLYERCYIANHLNAALFLSIHNNALDDHAYGGTMTLYYPPQAGGNFTGKIFAQIIQDKLVSSLKTSNRKIIERPGLVVLKSTHMPAALAEIAFMTNKKDMSNLKKASFKQKSAQALCDAIVKSLSKLKK